MLRPAPTSIALSEADMREYTEARKAWAAQQAQTGAATPPTPVVAPRPLTAAERIGLSK